MKITVSTAIVAPIADVWRLYNSPEDIKVWNTARQTGIPPRLASICV
jgi:uncharacterized protein YndB with AHSA1/START domain